MCTRVSSFFFPLCLTLVEMQQAANGWLDGRGFPQCATSTSQSDKLLFSYASRQHVQCSVPNGVDIYHFQVDAHSVKKKRETRVGVI